MKENFILIWYSRTIFNNLSDNNKIYFRKLEVNYEKITYSKLHIEFNLPYIYYYLE